MESKQKFTLTIFTLFCSIAFANTSPEITNVTFAQRTDGSGIVDIYYDVYDEDGDTLEITMEVSDDGGSTWTFACTQTDGDIGENQTQGNGKHITWQFGDEHPDIYSNQIVIKITADDNQVGECGEVTDIDGNTYETILIGDQCWMAENLKVTHYRNGDQIENVTDNSQWENLSTGAYCYYDNDPANADTYGVLYNWYAVDDFRGLAPEGWHVPTDAELTELTNYLGSNAGSKLAGGYDLWNDGALRNNSEFDTSGFSFLPGGYRYRSGTFGRMGNYGTFWSSTENYSSNAWYRHLNYNGTAVGRDTSSKQLGFSVRCLRD